MKPVRCLFPILLALIPALAFSQSSSDSVVVFAGEVAAPGRTAQFGAQFTEGELVGPLPLSVADPYIACVEVEPGVFEGVIDNPEEIEGTIVLISRGSCAFVLKVQAASEAGAIAVVMINNDEANPDDSIVQGGSCAPEVCTAPSAMVSFNSGQALLAEAASGTDAVIDPVRIDGPVVDPCTPFICVLHDTGVVQFEIYDYGFLGTTAEFLGTGFRFEGEQGLFVSTVLVGIDGNVVTNPYDGVSEWTAVTEVHTIAPPAPFDQGLSTSFFSDDLGVIVTERSYSRLGDPYVIVELEVENISGGDLDGVHVGVFADWDAGSASVDDAGGVNTDLGLVYVYDPVEETPFFGVAVLGADGLSGYSADAVTADDAQLWEALTTAVEPAPDPAERAAVTATGPFDLAAGTSVTVRFAFVGGASEAALFEHVEDAQQAIVVAAESAAPEGAFALSSIFPNPVESRATVGLAVPMAQAVRVAVYDVLGREVAVLHDGPAPAEAQTVRLAAGALPAGVYVVRLVAAGGAVSQRLTLLR